MLRRCLCALTRRQASRRAGAPATAASARSSSLFPARPAQKKRMTACSWAWSSTARCGHPPSWYAPELVLDSPVRTEIGGHAGLSYDVLPISRQRKVSIFVSGLRRLHGVVPRGTPESLSSDVMCSNTEMAAVLVFLSLQQAFSVLTEADCT